MRRFLFFIAVLATSTAGAVNNRSVSGSQQFTVICPDRDLRQNLAGAFDEVRRGLFSELGIQLGAPFPIYVNIAHRKTAEYRAETWTTRWLDAPDGARVQIDILLDDEMPRQRLQEHIVSALLLTIKYRNNPPEGGQSYTEAPAWMVEGLSEKVRLQTREPDAALYRGLLNAKNIPDLQSWLQVDPAKLDATSLGIYRAYACSLVSFFLGEPNGKKRLQAFLEKAPSDPAQAYSWMIKTFPSMGENGKNLAKWWSLSLAKLSAADRYLARSGPETDKALGQTLTFSLVVEKEKKTFELEQYRDFMQLPDYVGAMANMHADLARLTIHAHPLYRPVLVGYQEAVDAIKRGRLKNLDGKLEELKTLRAQVTQRLGEVSEYLTWFEATQTGVKGSGEFDSYFRLMESFRAPRPLSKEPIGRYLDAIEAELKN